MIIRPKKLLRFGIAFVAAFAISGVNARQNSQSVKAAQIIGVPAAKENAKGTLIIENSVLRFIHSEGTYEISTSSIQDVVTGADSQRAVGKTAGTISMLAPYGGGRFLSLFRKKIDTLTVEYRDADGAFHGVVFTMRSGQAETIKQELIAQGAHMTVTNQQDGAAQASAGSSREEHKQ
jgi:hypothetical protein